MNTYRIYEELRSSLGEEAAKSLAHTLGPMFEELGDTATKADVKELNATVGRLAEAQVQTETRVAELAGAQTRTEAQVGELTKAQARTEAQVGELTKAQTRTEAQVAELTKAQARTEAQVAELTKAQARTEAQVGELTKAQARTEVQVGELAKAQTQMQSQLVELTDAQTQMQSQLVELTDAQTQMQSQLTELTQVVRTLAINGERQATRLDGVLGRTFEMQFRDRLTSYLGRLMRRGKVLRNDELLDSISQALDAHEADELLRADAIASGIVDGVASHVLVEVSVTCDRDDVDRAERRAGILRKAGLAAIPLVACESISPELLAYARSKHVRIWWNGTVVDAAA